MMLLFTLAFMTTWTLFLLLFWAAGSRTGSKGVHVP